MRHHWSELYGYKGSDKKWTIALGRENRVISQFVSGGQGIVQSTRVLTAIFTIIRIDYSLQASVFALAKSEKTVGHIIW